MQRPSAIVTGASRGIGRAIALELARTHQVIGTYKVDREAAESLKAEAGIEIMQCDISSAGGRRTLVEFARSRFPRLDLLVNNAGVAPKQRRDILEAGEESFDELIETNLKGPHFLTQEIARWMLEARTGSDARPEPTGRIIIITSISAYTISTNRAEYCISKAGLSMAAAIWARRLAGEAVLVFEIRPGVIRTDMIAGAAKSYEERIQAGLLPQGRMGQPVDVARAVRAIADGWLDYSTGQVLDVDGGFRLRDL